MNEPEFRKRASERMWKCEGLFAEAKENHNLARARYRGRPKVQIQAYLIAMVQNLKRLVIAFYLWLVARSLLDQIQIKSGSSLKKPSPTFSTGPFGSRAIFHQGPPARR